MDAVAVGITPRAALGFKGDKPLALRLLGRVEPSVLVRSALDPAPPAEDPLGALEAKSPLTLDPESPPPPAIPARRDFSCLSWTARKCERSSTHLISSRTILDRVANAPAETTLSDFELA